MKFFLRYLRALAAIALIGITSQAIVEYYTFNVIMCVTWPEDCQMTNPRPTNKFPNSTVQGFREGPQILEFACSDGRYKVPVDMQTYIGDEEQYGMTIDPRRDGHKL